MLQKHVPWYRIETVLPRSRIQSYKLWREKRKKKEKTVSWLYEV